MPDPWYETITTTEPALETETYTVYTDEEDQRARLDISGYTLEDILEQTFSHYSSSLEIDEDPVARVTPDPAVYLDERLARFCQQFEDQYELDEEPIPIDIEHGDGTQIIEDHLSYEHVPDELDRELRSTLDGLLMTGNGISTVPRTHDQIQDERLQYTHPDEHETNLTILLAPSS